MRSGLLVTFVALGLCAFSTACNRSGPIVANNNTAAAVNTTPAATPDPFATTRGIYAKQCQSCHGAKGEGGRVKLEDGTNLRVPTLREGHALRHDDAEFMKQITKGGDGMPAFGDKLTPEQINELIRFVRREFQGK